MSAKRTGKKPSGPTPKDNRELEEIERMFSPFIGTAVEDVQYEWVPQRGGWVFKFTALHMPQTGTTHAKDWEMTTSQTRWFLTGLMDMGTWMITLKSMADDKAYPEDMITVRDFPTWDGEEWGEVAVQDRLPEAVSKLARITNFPDAEGSPDEDLRELERVTLVQMVSKLAQMNLVARLARKGAGEAQVARASAMTVPQLEDFQQAAIGNLGDLSSMAEWMEVARERKRLLEEEGEGE